jgi:hypothetical protein
MIGSLVAVLSRPLEDEALGGVVEAASNTCTMVK